VLLLSFVAAASESEWQFENWEGPPLRVKMFAPEDAGPETKIIIVMHGASRDVPRYYRDWKALGEAMGFIVVVPEFSAANFEGSARYNLGHVFDPATGNLRPQESWTFSAIEPLFDDVVSRLEGAQETYMIYGHSAGSQFVHRFMYYVPEARASRFLAANAGWYTLPVADFDYPYGFPNSGLDESELPRILAAPLVILLGREDTDKTQENLRKTPAAQKQGPNRLARGLTMFRVAKSQAEALGVDFEWQLVIVNGADHNNAKMAPAAARLAVNDKQ
jgi:hypothetical protein